MARVRSSDYDDKRRSILDAAAVLFSEYGFGSTSIAMLSQACGASKAWIYHYYPGKEAILFDLLHSHIGSLLATVRTVHRPDAAPRERLWLLVRALTDAYHDADATQRVLLNDIGRLSADQQRAIRDDERAIVDIFADTLAAAEPLLRTRPDLLKPLTMSVFGMLNWRQRWFRPEGPLSEQDYVDLVVGMVFDGLSGAVAAARRGRRSASLDSGERPAVATG